VERIVIADGLREGRSRRSIAAELGRDVSTISRNAHPTSGDCRPHAAQDRADARRPRPKPAQTPPRGRTTPTPLHRTHGHDRRPARRGRRPRRPRPLGSDLVIGGDQRSAIGTLVERTTRYTMVVHLGGSRTAEHVRDALTATVATLPDHLKRSLTWDQGSEMGRHHEFTLATDMPVYFCDPHSPWQRGSNENTNGLLRQYFPKGSDLAPHTPEDLAAVAAQLNRRPRKTLGWDTPAERLAKLLTEAS
jgi:IS30 family transposase